MGINLNEIEHSRRLDRLLHKPRLIGIEDVVNWAAREISLYKRNGDQITDIDLFYKTDAGIYIAEYKNSYGGRKKALTQLELGHQWVWDTFNRDAQRIFVYTPKFHYKYI